jgi:hypothetical protein
LSDRVEETPNERAYVRTYYDRTKDFRPTAPTNEGNINYPDLFPPAASPQNTPRTPDHGNDQRRRVPEPMVVRGSGVPKRICITLLLLALCGATFGWVTGSSDVVLVKAAWSFRGTVAELKNIQEEDWIVPEDGVSIGSRPEVLHYKQVVERIERVCTPTLVEQQEFSHYENICRDEQTGSEEEEVYSHTERVCYNDGICDEKDVYTKTHRPTYSTICKDVPRYRTTMRTVIDCKDVPIYRSEPVMGTKWLYKVDRWLPVATITMSSEDHKIEDVYDLEPNRGYTSEEWKFVLHTNDRSKFSVNRELYEKYKSMVGKPISLKQHWFGLWKTIE